MGEGEQHHPTEVEKAPPRRRKDKAAPPKRAKQHNPKGAGREPPLYLTFVKILKNEILEFHFFIFVVSGKCSFFTSVAS